jgi:hypothetical protein
MVKKTWLSPKEALEILAKNKLTTSRITMMKWIKTYKFGEKVEGLWVISPSRLDKFMKEKFHKKS